ncbi:serine hydrolase [Streptomyces sp. NPDC001941]|uniref:D-alanyl-D-alanine carboxypeptidase family protein n=1 Tax=Streptomyces sp. NPDC001941 TaxID=3154659 RepID=UPI00331C30C8
MPNRARLSKIATFPQRGLVAAGRYADAAVARAHRLGSPDVLPWPHEGQACVEVVGLGGLGSSGDRTPVPIASITKVMTALVVLRQHPLRPLEQGPLVRVDADAARESSSAIESVVPLEEGQSFPLRRMLEFLLVPSGNNVARLLARWSAGSEAAFVALMNRTAADLGMTSTTYTGSCGMDLGNRSTASDLLKLAHAVMTDRVISAIVGTSEVVLSTGEPGFTTNRLLGRHGVVGLKTGTTTPAGGNVLWAVNTEVHGTRYLVLGAVLAQRTGHSPVRGRAAVWAHTERMVKAVPPALATLLAPPAPGRPAVPAQGSATHESGTAPAPAAAA